MLLHVPCSYATPVPQHHIQVGKEDLCDGFHDCRLLSLHYDSDQQPMQPALHDACALSAYPPLNATSNPLCDRQHDGYHGICAKTKQRLSSYDGDVNTFSYDKSCRPVGNPLNDTVQCQRKLRRNKIYNQPPRSAPLTAGHHRNTWSTYMIIFKQT